jgi:hypothetical protein
VSSASEDNQQLQVSFKVWRYIYNPLLCGKDYSVAFVILFKLSGSNLK